MKIKNWMAGVAAATLAMTPIAAQANGTAATSLSVTQATTTSDDFAGTGLNVGTVVGVSFFFVLLVVFIFVAGETDEDSISS